MRILLPIVATLVLGAGAVAQATASGAVAVNVDNFVRAESDLYFGNAVKDAGGTGKFGQHREPMPIDRRTVVRANRDTLYSPAVIDLDAGPATVSLPDPHGRFMTLQAINEDHYTVEDSYGGGTYQFNKAQVGTRYVLVAIRTLVDPGDPTDLEAVHALQDAFKIEQPGGPGRFEVPDWDPVSQKQVREALLVLNQSLPDTRRTFGSKDEVDPIRHLIGTASAWGGNPEKDALYLNVTPSRNDGQTVYRLIVPAGVPVDGFWSISRYNAKGYFTANKLNAYTFNNITAQKGADGSVALQFGGCDGKVPNCLPIEAGWNYMVRLYRPRPEVLDGSWKFPEAQRVG